jgi:hypothetical protein
LIALEGLVMITSLDSNSFYGRARLELAALPTLRSVLQALLTRQLAIAFPTLTLDAATLQVALPETATYWRGESLTQLALQRLANGALPSFASKGSLNSLLAYDMAAPILLDGRPPDMSPVRDMLQALPALLPAALQQAVLDFWQAPSSVGGSRIEWLALLLRQSAWATYQAAPARYPLLRKVLVSPGQAQRDGGVAYLISSQWTDRLAPTQRLADALLLQEGDTWLLCPLGEAPQNFGSRIGFDNAWAARLQALQPGSVVQAELLPVPGDPFLALAQVIVDNQLQALHDLPIGRSTSAQALEQASAGASDFARRLQAAPALPAHALAKVQAAVPSWLKSAAVEDQHRLRRHVEALASVQQGAAGKGFADDIPSLERYTHDRLQETLRADFPVELRYRPEELIMEFHVANGVPGGWGSVHIESMTLPELAIANLAGAPKGRLSVRHARDLYLQPGLTPEYFLALIERIDIGRLYPELLKARLSDDPAEAQRRQALYFDQLQVQLPMQALQLKIEGKAGFTEQGYQLVKQALQGSDQPGVDGAVVRPLAFGTSPTAKPDPVANAFIFSAATFSGPLVVYQPMNKRSLQQFANAQAFMTALANDEELEQGLLAWMSPPAQRLYGHGGFHSPHLGVTVDDLFDWFPNDPPYLHRKVVGDVPTALYQAHCQALVTLADRSSVSNAESRWLIIKEGGWILFNTLQMAAQVLIWGGLVLLSPLVLAGWLGQVALTLDSDFAALKSDDPQRKLPAIIDLLMNLSSLALHGFRLAKDAAPPTAVPPLGPPGTLGAALLQRPLEPLPAPPSEPPGPTLVDDNGLAGWGRALSLEYASSQISPQAGLFDQLQALRVSKPAKLPPQVATGALLGLYRIGAHYFAELGAWFFQVQVSGDAVRIVHARHATWRGPWLKSLEGRWTLDLKLRLRGGAPSPLLTAQTLRTQARHNLDSRQHALQLARQRSAEQFDDYQPLHARMLAAIADAEAAKHALAHYESNPPHDADPAVQASLQERHRLAMVEAQARTRDSSARRDACRQTAQAVVDALDGLQALIEQAFELGLFDAATRAQYLAVYFAQYSTATQNLHRLFFAQYRALTQNGLWITQRVGMPANAPAPLREELLTLFVNAEEKLDRAYFYARAFENSLLAARHVGLDDAQLAEVRAAPATLLEENIASRSVMFDWLMSLEWVACESQLPDLNRRRFIRAQWQDLQYRSAHASELTVFLYPEQLTSIEQWLVLDSASRLYARMQSLARYYLQQFPAASGQYYWKLLKIAQALNADVDDRLRGLTQDPGSHVQRAEDSPAMLRVFACGVDNFVGDPQPDGSLLVGVDHYEQVGEAGPWQRRDVLDLSAPPWSLGECRAQAEILLSESATLLPRLRLDRHFYRTTAPIDFAESDLLARLRSLRDYYQRRPDALPEDTERLQRLEQAMADVAAGCLQLRLEVLPAGEPRIDILHFLHRHNRVQYRQLVARQPFALEPQLTFSQYQARVGGAAGRTWYVTLEYADPQAPASAFAVGVVNTLATPQQGTRAQLASATGEQVLAIARSRFFNTSTLGWFPL